METFYFLKKSMTKQVYNYLRFVFVHNHNVWQQILRKY